MAFLLGTQSSHDGVAGLRSIHRRQWEGDRPSSSYPSSDAARLFAVSCWGVQPNSSQSFLSSSTSSTRAWSPCHRALQCPLKEAVPKATSRRHFQARAFSPRSGPVGFTIATIFNYRHARPEVFVPFGNRRYWMGADRYGDGSASTELRCSEQTTIARVVGRRQSSMPPTWRIMTAPVTSPRLGPFSRLKCS